MKEIDFCLKIFLDFLYVLIKTHGNLSILEGIQSYQHPQVLIYNYIESEHDKSKNQLKENKQEKMSLFCDSSSQSGCKEDTNVEEFTLNIFSNILQSKEGLRLSSNEFVLKFFNQEDKIQDGTTHWVCSHQLSQFSIRISFELKQVKKLLEKRLPDILNKQFKFMKLTYQRPKMTLNYKLYLSQKPNSVKIFQKQINQIVSNTNIVIDRIKQLQKQHDKNQPYMELYAMRQCFEFNRSSRPKSSKISLRMKKNKNITEVMKLLGEGLTTLNKLPSVFIDMEIKKYEEQKQKILNSLSGATENKNKIFEQSILTSIEIINICNESVIKFNNQKQQELLSMISTALYTFRKQITIHKDSQLESLSHKIFTEILVKKQKTERGADQFENEIKLLTHLKGSFHPNIAQYYCKLEERPFLSEVLFIQHYPSSIGAVRNTLDSEKKLKILHQLSKVLNFLNYRKICHRDLKLDNIMIDKDLNAKVIDWGSVCSMYTVDNDPGSLRVKNQTLYSTEGYFQRYYEDIAHESFGHHYKKVEIEKGEYFDIYSFGFIVQKMFDLPNNDYSFWLDSQMQYLSCKCREKNPSDRLSALEIQIYLTMLRKKLKKFKEEGLSSPISSNC